MKARIDRGRFWDMFKSRVVLVTAIPPGNSRDLAQQANEAEGHGDASLRTRAELSALFDLLLDGQDQGPRSAELALLDKDAGPTPAGHAIQDYLAASRGKDELFDEAMYMVHVTGWPQQDMRPEHAVKSSGDARLALWRTDPRDDRHIAPPDREGILLASSRFSLRNSGNRTLRAPKRSWKVNFDLDGGDDRLAGMSRLNLKSMYNDPSQMRESLAWRLFERAGVPASRHTYAKLGINADYMGLFFFVEQVDRKFLKDHFGKNDAGNLYKAHCGDVGCATLEHLTGRDGDDGGRQYFTPGSSDHTYRLKSNEHHPSSNTYDDLAALVRTINGIGLSGGQERFRSDAFRESVESMLNAGCLLRWAGANVLLGSWDNYFATPSNYYLYNSGRRGRERDFVQAPYFTLIPWDYDNCLGIDYFDTEWQYTDLLDWAGNTANYCKKVGYPAPTSPTPLVQNLLRNPDFRRYYLDHLEHLLDTEFNPEAISAAIGSDGGEGLWGRVRQAAYLESHTPYEPPFTGRQFTNDEIYRSAVLQHRLRHRDATIEGILEFVRMRYDSARNQLSILRRTDPPGASGASFCGVMEPVPARG